MPGRDGETPDVQLAAARHLRHSCARRIERGFTILELALTLAILAVLAVGILVPFVAQVSQRKIASTERVLEQAKDALIGYATATGRLPCPATAASNGAEAFAAGGTTANGICQSFWGFLPAATLGFTPIDSQGFAIDGWGTAQNRIRYAVASSTTPVSGIIPTPPTYTFTRTGGMREATADAIAASRLLVVCSNGTGAVAAPAPACGGGAVTLTSNAPAIVWSNGANAATGGTSVDEAQNPHSNASAVPPNGSADRIFVSRVSSDVTGVEFDDIVTWLSVGNLVSRMVMGGQLP
jgi:prepilin-type N-terminal cleavage/methylation domain-containing protein